MQFLDVRIWLQTQYSARYPTGKLDGDHPFNAVWPETKKLQQCFRLFRQNWHYLMFSECEQKSECKFLMSPGRGAGFTFLGTV